MTTARDLRTLPKGHLHLHLEGAMRPSTLHDLADHQGIPVPPVRGFTSFKAFSGMYNAACRVLVTEKELRRLVREVVEDAADDGVHWIEPAFYSPRYIERFGSNGGVIEIVLDELAAAGQDHGVGAGLILAADRTVDPEEAVALAGIAASMAGSGVVGFGLANDEADWPPGPFAAAFQVAREAGLIAAPHGGELAGPESVMGCLDACGARRVMHGVRAAEDPHLVTRLADEGICQDPSPVVVAGLDVVDLSAGVHGRDERLRAVLGPPDRPAGHAGQKTDQAFLPGEMLLVAEAASHVRANHPHRTFVESADLSYHRSELMRLLVRRHDVQPAGAGIPAGLGAVTFEREAGDPMALQTLDQAVWGAGHRRLHPPGATLEMEELVRPPLRVQQRGAGPERGLGVDHRRELVVADLDEFERVLGDGPGGSHDRGHGFA